MSAGGVIGSLFRYLLGLALPSSAQGNLAANIIASALAAHILVQMEQRDLPELRYFLLPGFCGGLGTFSAITFEAVTPGDGQYTYLALNLILSLLAVVISLRLSRKLISGR